MARMGSRIRRAGVGMLLAAAAGLSCAEGPSGPGGSRFGTLRIKAVLGDGEDPDRLGLDRIRITIERKDGNVVVDTLMDWDPGADRTYDWLLRLDGVTDDLEVESALLANGQAMYVGGRDVVLREAGLGETSTEEIALSYIGPALAARVEVTPPTSVLTVIGATVQLTATAFGRDDEILDLAGLTWGTPGPGVASVDENGLVTAVGEGAVTISATADGMTGTAEVTVRLASRVTSTITASPADVEANGVDASVITVRLFDGSGAPLAASGGTVALTTTLGSLTDVVDHDDGTYTAGLTSTGMGLAVVTGTLNGEALTDSAEVEFTDVTTGIARIDVSPEGWTFTALGQTQEFSAIVRDEHGDPIPNVLLIWGVDDDVATVDPVTGLITAVRNGTTTIRAAAGGVEGLAGIVVEQVAASVLVTPAEAALAALDEQVQLSAQVLDANDHPLADQSVVWLSSAPAVAQIDDQGLVTALGNGPATITATAGPAHGAATITVRQIVVSIEVSPDTATLIALDEAVQLVATGRDPNGFPVPDQTVTWNSENETVATVDDAGLVTAVGNGVAQVRAAFGELIGSAMITVSQRVAKIALTRACPDENLLLTEGELGAACDTLTALGDQLQVLAEAFDANGFPVAQPAVTWEITPADVASIDAGGLVTAVGNGTAIVTATADDAEAKIDVVVRQSVVTLIVTPDHATIPVGGTVQLTPEATDANGHLVPDAVIIWASKDPSLATVDDSGLVTGVKTGKATIRASVDGAWVEVEVQVE